MVISLGETIAILKKWKDESAQIFVEVESPFQRTVPASQGYDARWTMHQHVQVSRLTPPPEGERSTKTIVQFEGPSGTLSLSIGECRFAYDEPRAASPDDREEAEALTVSALSVLFPSEACFHFYELRDAITSRVSGQALPDPMAAGSLSGSGNQSLFGELPEQGKSAVVHQLAAE